MIFTYLFRSLISRFRKPSIMAAFLFLAASALVYTACSKSTSPDETPPTVKQAKPDTLRITDTLTVRFSEKVDTSYTIEAIQGDFKFKKKNAEELQIFGPGVRLGKAMFNGVYPIKFRLNGLTDLNGNTSSTPLLLTAYRRPWLDRDFADSTFNSLDTIMRIKASDSINSLRLFDDVLSWMPHTSGAVMGDSINKMFYSEGGILGSRGNNQHDYEDFKLLFLQIGDTLSLSLQCPENSPLSIFLYGPLPWNSAADSLPKVIDAINKKSNIDDERSYLIDKACTNNSLKINGSFAVSYTHQFTVLKTAPTFQLGAYIVVIKTQLTASNGYYLLGTQIKGL